MYGYNAKYKGFLKSHMWEAVVRAKIDGLQHCCEHINNTCWQYCLRTLCIPGAHVLLHRDTF